MSIDYDGPERRTLDSRVSVIENDLQHMAKRVDGHMESEEQYLLVHSALIKEIRDEQAKMKGFWGGVVFVFSAMSVAAAGFINHLTGK